MTDDARRRAEEIIAIYRLHRHKPVDEADLAVGQYVADAVAQAVKERDETLSHYRVDEENKLRDGFGRRMKEQAEEIARLRAALERYRESWPKAFPRPE